MLARRIMANRGPNLTDDEKCKIVFLYENNIQMSEISRLFNRDPSCIFRVIQQTKAKRKTINDVLEEYATPIKLKKR